MEPVKYLPNLPKWLNIGLAFPIIILNGWLLIQLINYFQPLVSVVSVAILLAFILDYPIQILQKRRVTRNLAILLVLLLSVIILGAIVVILVPLILEQLNELANLLPYWIESGTQQIEALQNWASTQQLPINLSGLANEILGKISSQLQSFTGKILGFALDTIGNLLNVLITIVLTIYLVLNGEGLWDGIYLWFPKNMAKKVRELLREDFNNYFIGQATLGAILAIAITLAFLA
ncbi:MAG: hypothetical protein RLZZ176_2252, partial [Cyanobacteriota bacterium]